MKNRTLVKLICSQIDNDHLLKQYENIINEERNIFYRAQYFQRYNNLNKFIKRKKLRLTYENMNWLLLHFLEVYPNSLKRIEELYQTIKKNE